MHRTWTGSGTEKKKTRDNQAEAPLFLSLSFPASSCLLCRSCTRLAWLIRKQAQDIRTLALYLRSTGWSLDGKFESGTYQFAARTAPRGHPQFTRAQCGQAPAIRIRGLRHHDQATEALKLGVLGAAINGLSPVSKHHPAPCCSRADVVAVGALNGRISRQTQGARATFDFFGLPHHGVCRRGHTRETHARTGRRRARTRARQTRRLFPPPFHALALDSQLPCPADVAQPRARHWCWGWAA